MNFKKLHIFRGDRIVWTLFFFLATISMIEVYSAGSYLALKEKSIVSPMLRQFAMLLMSGVVAWILHNIPCRMFKKIPTYGFLITVFLLGWALSSGQNLNNGARWVNLMGISIQPSEIAKIYLVTTIALTLANAQRTDGLRKGTVRDVCLMGGGGVLAIITQNLSTGLLILAVVIFMLFLGRVPIKTMRNILGCLLILGACGYGMLKILPSDPNHSLYKYTLTQRLTTWRSRIATDSIPPAERPEDFVITDKNRQRVNGKIALARSHGIGVGPGRSVQRDYLSAAYSDFIFAIICEEFGLFGCILVTGLYFCLLFRVKRIAERCERSFPAYLVMGLGLMLVLQAIINMLVVVGIGPVTGQTLPLISKGGTSTVLTGAYFGMILSVSRSARRKDKTSLTALAPEPNAATQQAFAED